MSAIPFSGFCGPSYQFDNKYAAIERLVNWYTLPNESNDEKKFQAALEPSAGNAPFCALPVPSPFNQPCRGLLELRGIVYGVNGTAVFSIDQKGRFALLGNVTSDGKPVSMVANGTGQIFIASAGNGYVIAGGQLQAAGSGFLGAQFATFQDGYVIVVTPNSNQFQISGSDNTPLGDATQWDASNISVQAGQADLLQAAFSTREYLYLFGQRRGQVYYNAGSNGIGMFPFQSWNETFFETGLAAVQSLAEIGDSMMWIGQDARGQRACWRMHAFTPERASNFAIEQRWAKYASVSDAVAFPFTWKGHTMYQVTFPTAAVNAQGVKTSATWVYDVTASELLRRPMWSERAYQTALGYAQGRSEQFHCYCYGVHLVGSTGIDGNPGAIYQYSDSQYTDCGTDIAGNQTQQAVVRDRICPHIWTGKRQVYGRIEFELAKGVGLDGGGFGSDPQLLLRWSNDGGNTWGRELPLSAGGMGDYGELVYLNRCGYALRDRVFWLRCTDPVYWSIVNAQLYMGGGK